MRPIATNQNHLHYPINELLGTEANVRLLRILAVDTHGPLSVPDAALRAGLTPRGARKALQRLTDSGFVELVGGGRKQQFALNSSNTLVQALVKLFQAESDRFSSLMTALAGPIESLRPAPRSAWIESFPQRPGGALAVSFVQGADHLDSQIQTLRKALIKIEKKFELTIEINGYTRADLLVLKPKQELLLYGISLKDEDEKVEIRPAPITHEDADKRLLELSQAMAEELINDPSLLPKTRKHLQGILKKDLGTAAGDLREWRNILKAYSVRRIVRFLTSNSERAVRLRQSSPFFAVCTKQQRNRILKKVKKI